MRSTGSREQSLAFAGELLRRVAALPGVVSASVASGLPMQDLSEASFGVDGAPKTDPAQMAAYRNVDENYFATMGISLLRGRAFTRAEAENEKTLVVVVNQAMAKKIWPGQDPIGKRIRTGDKTREVIGMVADVNQLGPESPVHSEIYYPARALTTMTLVVRTTLDPLGSPRRFRSKSGRSIRISRSATFAAWTIR